MMSDVDKDKKLQRDNFWYWFRQNAVKIALLCVTAYFSWHAGSVVTSSLYLGALYVCVIELPALAWDWLSYDAENLTQEKHANTGWQFSLLMVALTAAASGAFLAREAKIFDLFANIPGWAQVVGVILIPIAAAIQLFLYGQYRNASDWIKEKRALDKEKRDALRDETRASIQADVIISREVAGAKIARAELHKTVLASAAVDKHFEEKYGKTYQSVVDAPNPTRASIQKQ